MTLTTFLGLSSAFETSLTKPQYDVVVAPAMGRDTWWFVVKMDH